MSDTIEKPKKTLGPGGKPLEDAGRTGRSAGGSPSPSSKLTPGDGQQKARKIASAGDADGSSPAKKDSSGEVNLLSRDFWTGRRIAWAACGALLLVALTLFFTGGSNDPVYLTEKLARTPFQVIVSTAGRLEGRNTTKVTSEITGRVTRILVREGDMVRQGQVLAELDTADWRARIADSEAQAASARATANEIAANLAEARIRNERAAELYRRNALRSAEVQEARADYMRASANLARARADVSAAQAKAASNRALLASASLRAPIDGVVLKRHVEENNFVSDTSTAPLFTLASDLALIELKTDVPEDRIALLKTGQSTNVFADAFPNRRFSGRLVSLASIPNEADSAALTQEAIVTYPATILVDNGAGFLRPGLKARGDIVVHRSESALSVPNISLRFVPDADELKEINAPPLPRAAPGEKWARVWVLEGDTVRPRAVKLGLDDGRRTMVLAGELREGESLIVDVAGPRLD